MGVILPKRTRKNVVNTSEAEKSTMSAGPESDKVGTTPTSTSVSLSEGRLPEQTSTVCDPAALNKASAQHVVLKKLEALTERLQRAKEVETLLQKFKMEEWIAEGATATANELVLLALDRIKDQVTDYDVFIRMLKSMPGVKSIAYQMIEECPVSAPEAQPPPSRQSLVESEIPDSIRHTDVQVDEVRSNMLKLNKMFLALKNGIRCELENPKDGREAVSVSVAVDNIMNSPTAVWEPHEKLVLKENRAILRSSEDIQGVLDCLGIDWDYLNPDIYENLINDFSLHSLDKQLAEYRAELQKFIDETPITVFSTVVKKKDRKIPKGFKELVTHHDWKSPVYLKDVEEFRRDVASQYSLRQCAVLLVALGKGSVIISLLVPVSAESLIKSTKPEFFKKHKISIMVFNGSFVTSEDGSTALHLVGETCHEETVTVQRETDPKCVQDLQTSLHEASTTGETAVVTSLQYHGPDKKAKDKGLRASGAGEEATVTSLLQSGVDPSYEFDGRSALHMASKGGHTKTVRVLLQKGADPNQYDDVLHTPLHEASGAGQTAVVTLLLDHGADRNARDKDGRTALHMAAKCGHTETVRVLLQRGADPNQCADNVHLHTPLHEASAAGQTAVVTLLLDHGADRNARDKDGRSALHMASKGGDTKIVGVLLQRGADPNQCDDDLHTPLHEASAAGQTAAVTLLLNYMADENTRDKDGRSALHMASKGGHTKIVRVLLQRRTDPNQCDDDLHTPLHEASAAGQTAVVTLLLHYRADKNTRDKDGRSALHMASKGGHTKTVRVLLQRGADPNQCDDDLHTPLHEASAAGQTAVVTLLLDRGADRNARDKDGHTALHMTTECGLTETIPVFQRERTMRSALSMGEFPFFRAIQRGDFGAVKLLLDNGADPNIPDRMGMSPLFWAIQSGHLETVRLLLDKGADPNIPDRRGMSPLFWAIRSGHLETMKLLLDKGADPNIPDRRGMSPLIWAIKRGHLETMKLLLDKGADPNIPDRMGVSPLYWAIERGHREAVRLLLDKGADPNIPDEMGVFPLYWAIRSGHREAVRLLLDHGADPDIPDEMGCTAREHARMTHHPEILQLLSSRRTTEKQLDPAHSKMSSTPPMKRHPLQSKTSSTPPIKGYSPQKGSAPTAAPTAAATGTSATASKSIIDEVPDLNRVQRIRYRSGTKIKTYRAINDIAREWEAIARELGLEDKFLKAQSSHDDSIFAAMNVVNKWTRSDKTASWAQLIRAMKVGGNLAVEADELKHALLNMV